MFVVTDLNNTKKFPQTPTSKYEVATLPPHSTIRDRRRRGVFEPYDRRRPGGIRSSSRPPSPTKPPTTAPPPDAAPVRGGRRRCRRRRPSPNDDDRQHRAPAAPRDGVLRQQQQSGGNIPPDPRGRRCDGDTGLAATIPNVVVDRGGRGGCHRDEVRPRRQGQGDGRLLRRGDGGVEADRESSDLPRYSRGGGWGGEIELGRRRREDGDDSAHSELRGGGQAPDSGGIPAGVLRRIAARIRWGLG